MRGPGRAGRGIFLLCMMGNEQVREIDLTKTVITQNFPEQVKRFARYIETTKRTAELISDYVALERMITKEHLAQSRSSDELLVFPWRRTKEEFEFLCNIVRQLSGEKQLREGAMVLLGTAVEKHAQFSTAKRLLRLCNDDDEAAAGTLKILIEDALQRAPFEKTFSDGPTDIYRTKLEETLGAKRARSGTRLVPRELNSHFL